MPTDPTPTIETERLILEPLGLEHAPSYTEHFVDYEVIRYLSAAVPWPYPEGGVRDFIEAVVLPQQGESRWDWALTLRGAPGEAIGSVGLWRPGSPENRGFWLSRRHWARGLMTEASEAVVAHAFEGLGFEELILSNAVGNARSSRIKARSGAERVGTEPASFVDPQFTEHELWRLRAEAWRAAKNDSE